MAEIARDPADLVKQMMGRHHQYPDGAVLFLGTMFAPIKDRGAKGQGFTHKAGDVTTICRAGARHARQPHDALDRGAAVGVRHGRADAQPRAARPAVIGQ